jgi:hypothetical protein
LFLGQRHSRETTADAGAELREIREDRLRVEFVLLQPLMVFSLFVHDVASLREQLPPLS